MKICSKCKISKTEEDFYNRGTGIKRNDCKNCSNKCKQQYYINNKEKIKRKVKKWAQSNKEQRKEVQKKYNNTIKGRLIKTMKAAHSRAKINNLTYNLDTDFLLELWVKQNGKCALTKIEFELINKTNFISNPFAPSIDKINPKQGYTKNNVRLVCVAVNYALNEFGEEIFKQICQAYLNQSINNVG